MDHVQIAFYLGIVVGAISMVAAWLLAGGR